MTGDRPTSAQHQAITRTGENVCVTAGAGSGKTRVLVDRFVHLVREGAADVDRILAITFTEKAAAEMKERIALRFEELGDTPRRQAVEFAYVSTIDGFCSRLLRENALEAGVDPHFSVLEEREAKELMEEIADQLLREASEERMRAYCTLVDPTDLAGILISIYEQARHSGLAIESSSLAPLAKLGAGPSRLRELLSALQDEMPVLTAGQRAKLEGHFSLEERISTLDPGASPAEMARFVEDLKKTIHAGAVRKPPIGDLLKEIKICLEKEILAELLEKHAAPCRAWMAELLGTLHREYARQKRARMVLDFADLETLTRDLLQASPEVRKRLQRKFRFIFLDEFQDTNRLQMSLLAQLTRRDNLFVVGDGKQSIYGFRHADVSILAGYRRETTEAGGHIPLQENFRSRPEIVSFVNALFPSFWKGKEVPFEPMRPAAAHVAKPKPSVELLVAAGDRIDEARYDEARRLAARLQVLVEEAEVRFTRESSERLGQPLGYGDVVLLFRSTSSMRIYERELARAQIPYVVQKGRGFFQTQEVRDLINLIQILDNPRDDIRLAAVLRSPMCGLTDDDLFRLARCGGEPGQRRLYDRLKSRSKTLSRQGQDRVAKFLAALHLLRSRKGKGRLWTSLAAFMAQTSLAGQALLHPNGRRRYANIRKLVEMVRELEEEGAASLPEMVETLERYRTTEVRESEAAADGAPEGAVRLMTIHAAKGLQFPCVVVADLGRGGHAKTAQDFFHPEEGVALKLFDPRNGSRGLEPISFLRIRAMKDEAEQQEGDRLLYVAVTRAQEHLILSGGVAPRSNKNCWIQEILRGLGLGREDVPVRPAVRKGPGGDLLLIGASTPETGRVEQTTLRSEESSRILRGQPLSSSSDWESERQGAEEMLRRVSLPLPAPETTPYLVTATEIVQHQLCPRRYHLRYRVGAPALESPPVQERLSEDGRAGAKDDELPAEVLGDRVHRILAEEPGSARIEVILEDLGDEAARREARKQVENFRASPLGRETEVGEVFREIPFALARCGSILRGQIDLLIHREDEGLVLVDYKTSRIPAERVSERALDYEPQLRIYALAVQELWGRQPVAAYLYFLSPDVIHEVDLSPAALERAEQSIRSFFEAHQTQEYPQAPESHCSACGYRKHYCPNITPGGSPNSPS